MQLNIGLVEPSQPTLSWGAAPSPASQPSGPHPLHHHHPTPRMHVHKGYKYTNLSQLLPPLPSPPVPACKRSTSTRSVTSLRWLEAWNVCVATRVQAAQDTALALVNYQCIVCQLSATYGPAAALKYLQTSIITTPSHWEAICWCGVSPIHTRQQTSPFLTSSPRSQEAWLLAALAG